MFDGIVKIIDRCIDLAKRREQTNRNLFTDFVVPIFADFEIVHKNYLDSFRTYREKIKDDGNFDEIIEDLLRLVDEDILFSASIRGKLWELNKWTEDKQIGDFISSIINYVRFNSSWDEVEYDRIPSNTRRLTTKERLSRILETNSLSSKEKKDESLKAINNVLEKSQYSYLSVVREYNIVKDELLRGI